MEIDRVIGLFGTARVARLATVSAAGAPHIVPITFALGADGDLIYSAVDHKPKRTTSLRRLANIEACPDVCVIADHYEDDWDALWWARADGVARVVAVDGREASTAIEALAIRYAQYRERPPDGPVILVEVRRWSGWSARDAQRA